MSQRSKVKYDDNQPHSVYTRPLKPVLYIQDKLGVAEGQFDFSHPFKHITNIMDLIKTILAYESKEMLINTWTKVPVNTKVNQETLEKLDQIWRKKTWLKVHLDIFDKTMPSAVFEEVVFKKPEKSSHIKIYELPPLRALTPKDDRDIDTILVEIGAEVLERDAYEGIPPSQLFEAGCYELDPNDPTDMTKTAWFRRAEDVINSPYKTYFVSKPYYNNTRNRLFDKWYEIAVPEEAQIIKLAQELSGAEYSEQEESDEGDVTDLD